MRGFSVLLAGRTASFFSALGSFSTKVFARTNYKLGGLAFLALVFLLIEFVFPAQSFAFEKSSGGFQVSPNIETETESIFTESVSQHTEVLKYQTKQVADPNLQEGETKVIQTGVHGKKVVQTKTVFHNGQKYATENTVLSETKPTEEVLAVSDNNVIREIQTPYGLLKYKTKLNVWATSYDPNCRGCNGITSIGLKAGYGVIAVDPKVIPLRSKVYVPGYGVAIAGDTGGSIKGNKIDLGFDDVRAGNWSSRYTDIYLLES